MTIFVKESSQLNEFSRNYDEEISNLKNTKQDNLMHHEIPNSDFNNITALGYHWINPNNQVHNHPYPGTWGILEMLGFGYQRFTTYDRSGNFRIAVRSYTNNT